MNQKKEYSSDKVIDFELMSNNKCISFNRKKYYEIGDIVLRMPDFDNTFSFYFFNDEEIEKHNISYNEGRILYYALHSVFSNEKRHHHRKEVFNCGENRRKEKDHK